MTVHRVEKSYFTSHKVYREKRKRDLQTLPHPPFHPLSTLSLPVVTPSCCHLLSLIRFREFGVTESPEICVINMYRYGGRQLESVRGLGENLVCVEHF